MAEPGDPDLPKQPDPAADHDDLIGFSSAAALEGRPRVVPEPVPETVSGSALSAEPDAGPLVVPEILPDREPEPVVGPAPDLFEPIAAIQQTHSEETRPFRQPEPPAPPAVSPSPARAAAPPPTPPGWAMQTPAAPGSIRRQDRTIAPPPEVANSSELYAVYALLLFAVPTLGVSAVIALLAVTGRPGPGGTVAASHFVFLQRTLWSGAVVALLGAILIAVGLGVFVLFIVAVWLILRGASGILALKAGRAVRDPRGWFLA